MSKDLKFLPLKLDVETCIFRILRVGSAVIPHEK